MGRALVMPGALPRTGRVIPTQPTYTGHFTNWFGFNANQRNFAGTFTFSVHGKGSDGSRLDFHVTGHDSMSASGHVISFEKPRCG